MTEPHALDGHGNELLVGRSAALTDVLSQVRLVAPTAATVLLEGEAGIREDFFYRLSVFPLVRPPLRERVEDIPELAMHLMRRSASLSGKAVHGFTPSSIECLCRFAWPGNIRQLQKVVERAVILG